MFSLACFVAIGTVFGFILTLPGFAICVLATVVMYAAFADGFTGMGAHDVFFAAFSLQLGYFLALIVRAVSARPSSQLSESH
jgi:hypothetical protein